MSQTDYYTSIITAFRKSLQQLSCLDSHKISTMAIERIGRQFRDTQGTYTVHYLGNMSIPLESMKRSQSLLCEIRRSGLGPTGGIRWANSVHRR
jgi:hypothetical protein